MASQATSMNATASTKRVMVDDDDDALEQTIELDAEGVTATAMNAVLVNEPPSQRQKSDARRRRSSKASGIGSVAGLKNDTAVHKVPVRPPTSPALLQISGSGSQPAFDGSASVEEDGEYIRVSKR